ncbi:MAG TPA: DNA-3-methyladenine glycosylase 2 family protein [Candidatus Saccharimonadales bacterium]|nr:DNA-3-methyladenine glycosylase 2 family protein [Candidatus Saccharimonadales bacterium]
MTNGPDDPRKKMEQAAKHLGGYDPILAAVIAEYGLCTIAPHTNYYQDLVESIIGQQLSVKAAATIRDRFKALFDGHLPLPEEILTKDIETLRSVGLSRAKATYVRDLAQHVVDGRMGFDHLPFLSNEEIIAELTDVKGIGEWTVHMFLMFCVGRTDVLAYGDLGIKNGIRQLYGLDHTPTPQEIKDIAQHNRWHPYESVACWYIWRSLDNKPISS